ncbi:hypothetical protein HGH92_04125 [Chitinophaga varians]|uniref:Uncharacterized protein n=1 Tax=Chitinophaga varians TaxID=2202339 RepID=A0A847RK07_9BACT|nr:hypothetical protein [Chitinophaga varians]NLR63486.1 hypothetical protein [Chitinophaga varians]
MDAKNIFIASGRYLKYIQWVPGDRTEWHYVGVGDDYDENKVDAFIQCHFGTVELFLVLDRHRVQICQAANAAPVIGLLFSENGLTVCNRDFTKMMVFKKIGVMKYGERHDSPLH